jgi:hypothetical protein
VDGARWFESRRDRLERQLDDNFIKLFLLEWKHKRFFQECR